MQKPKKKPVLSEKDLAQHKADMKFRQYLRFADSRASFPTPESYTAYFDQLYRQNDITAEQYRYALRQRSISDRVIDVRLGLLQK